MALTKDTVIDKIEIDEYGVISIRRATYILEDGVRVSDARYHRKALTPGQDVTQESAKVRAVAVAVWTPKVIADYQALVTASAVR